jgi:hypothetical protein
MLCSALLDKACSLRLACPQLMAARLWRKRQDSSRVGDAMRDSGDPLAIPSQRTRLAFWRSPTNGERVGELGLDSDKSSLIRDTFGRSVQLSYLQLGQHGDQQSALPSVSGDRISSTVISSNLTYQAFNKAPCFEYTRFAPLCTLSGTTLYSHGSMGHCRSSSVIFVPVMASY